MNSNLKVSESSLPQTPQLIDWGLIDYALALEKQLQLVEEVSQNENHSGYILFCTHPHVVTTGRQTKPEDVFGFKGPIIEVSRGGRATYHGPSQLVVYPILNLKKSRHGRAPQEIRGYLRAFEQAIVDTLALYDISAVGKTLQKTHASETETEETGVWVGSQKVASLGIAVKKWTCYHGASINLDHDPEAFIGLNPCGFKSSTMTSLESLLKKSVQRDEFKAKLLFNLTQSL